jgi:hypothetical protein
VNGNADKTTYTVIAKRWKRGWELHVDGVGVTQSRRLNDAEAMVRDYIALDTGAAPTSFDIEIIPEVGHGLDSETREARRAVAEAEKAQRAAAARSRDVARSLKGIGLSGREIAVVLRLSPQRVSQLLRWPHGVGAASPSIVERFAEKLNDHV